MYRSTLRDENGVETDFHLVLNIIHRIRALLSACHIPISLANRQPLNVILVAPETILSTLITGHYVTDIIEPLGRCRVVQMVSDRKEINTSGCVSGTVSASDVFWSIEESSINTTAVIDDHDDDGNSVDDNNMCSNDDKIASSIIPATCQIFLHVAGLIDVSLEQKRCQDRLVEIEESIKSLEKKRQNPTYSEKVPMKTQLIDKKKLYELNSELDSLKEVVSNLKDIKQVNVIDTVSTISSNELLLDALYDYLGIQQQSIVSSNLIDLEAKIESILNNELKGGDQPLQYSKVKQWLSWSIRMIPSNENKLIDSKKYSIYRKTVENNLTHHPYFLTGTTYPTVADVSVAYTLTLYTDYSQWICSSDKEYIVKWFNKLKTYFNRSNKMKSLFK